MSAPDKIDVLAVMARVIEREYNPFEPNNQSEHYPRLIEARAAVAELVEAVKEYDAAEINYYDLSRADPSVIKADAERHEAARKRLRAALAKFGEQP